jgi:hypothetical protein
MPLSDDQKAMLRLLAQREQGYDDLAALMGIGVDEVRARVKDALDELEEEGGAPAPAERAAPKRRPRPEPEAPAPERPSATPERPAPAPRPPRRTPPPRPTITLPSDGRTWAAIVAAAAVAVVVLVLALGGGDDSGDTDAPATAETTAAEEETVEASSNPKLTQAVLDPLDGGDAKGVATFGRVKNALALQIEAEGLEPTEEGESYTVWLYESPQKRLPLASTRVDDSGRIGAQVQVPTEVLAYLAKETFDQIDVSLTSDQTLKASLAKATREKKAPVYTGTDVLRGQITGPIIGAANK